MFSEPVIGERFFGREDVLKLLNKRASDLKDGYRQNVALTGQSLAGKSSIILQFLNTAREDGFIPIYVEVTKENFESFADKFIATMLHNALLKAGEHAGIEMEDLLEKTEKRLPRTYSSVKQVSTYIERKELDNAYSGLLGLTSTLKNELGMPCIVILDEFDNLEGLGIKNPFLGFGKVIMVQKDTMYIVSSSRNEAIKKIISEKLSLLFGNFEVVKVANFDLATAVSFLSVKLAEFEVESRLKKFLVSFTDGNPFYLDKLVSRTKELAILRMTSFIDSDLIAEAILDLVFDSGGSIHQYLTNYLLELLDSKNKDAQMLILNSMADGQTKRAEIARNLKMKQAEASKLLARLAELGIVSKNGSFYNIDDSMLAFWLKSVHRRRKEFLIGGIFDKLPIFKNDVVSYINDFLKESDKNVITRLTELFDLFSDDLVQFDSRQIRLPHFTRIEPRTLADSKPFIAASFKGQTWMIQPFERYVTENDIIYFMRSSKTIGNKISNKIVIPLSGIDENAKLLAKELKISIWGTSVIATLMKIYGKKGLIISQ